MMEEEETDEADAADRKIKTGDMTGETADQPETKRCTYRQETED